MPVLFDQITAMSTLLRAFDRVEENHGGPGVDGETVEDFGTQLESRLLALRQSLRSGSYRPAPLLHTRMAKAEGGIRILRIPCVRDRVAQTAAALVLTRVLDPEFEDVSYGYREGRSVDQAVRRIMQLRDRGFRWVVDADIERYFDEIPSDKLLERLARHVDEEEVLALVRQWLTAEVRDGAGGYRMAKGVAQGSPLSPLLANLYLDRLDEAHLRAGQKLVRFADDFVILCKTRPDAEQALDLAEAELRKMQLALNPTKTRITHFDHGFKYLGTIFLRSLVMRARYREPDPLWGPASASAESEAPAAPVPIEQTALADAMRGALERLPKDRIRERWEALREGEAEADLPPCASGHDPLLRTLYIMEQGAELGKEYERFIVRKKDTAPIEVPAIKVDQILIFGNVRITTPAMQFCLIEDIPIVLLSSRGQYYGVVESAKSDQVTLHARQFARVADPNFALGFSRGVVRGKLVNARTLLLRQGRRTEDPDIQAAASEIEGLIGRIAEGSTLDELRGLEGAGAARYFSVWPKLLGPEWGFTARRRQPPPDPVNSLLSFGYTLLFYNVYAMLRARGLHPHVGIYHALRPGHPALCSDLMEEFRAPIVDATVLTLIHRRQVSPADFVLPAEPGLPCLLTDAARKRVTHAFEQAMNRPVSHPDAGERCDYRRAIALQAERVIAYLRDEAKPYTPFLTR